MQEAMKFAGLPDQLVVTAFSAGGFGTAPLTDDIMRLFPGCKDVTSCMDGGSCSTTASGIRPSRSGAPFQRSRIGCCPPTSLWTR